MRPHNATMPAVRMLAAALAALLLAAPAFAARFIDLGFAVEPEGVSGNGRVVVGAYTPGREPNDPGCGFICGLLCDAPCREAFRWTSANGFETIVVDTAPGDYYAVGASQDGEMIGVRRRYVGTGGYFDPGFRWSSDGQIIEMDPNGAWSATALGISDDGLWLYGEADYGTIDAVLWSPVYGTKHLYWEAAVIDVSADITAVGDYRDPLHTSGFMWLPFLRHLSGDSAVLPGVPGETLWGSATAISGDAHVVAGYLARGVVLVPSYSYESEQPVRWVDEQVQPLPQLLPNPASNAIPSAVSYDGKLIVGYDESPGPRTAVIWNANNQIRSIQDLLTNDNGLDLAGWQLEEATDISHDGSVIVGTGVNPDGHDHGWVAVIPLACPGDLNQDGVVDASDLTRLLANFGDQAAWLPADGDLDADGDVDSTDLSNLLLMFGQPCPTADE